MKSIYLRIFVYAIIIVTYRGIYLIAAFLMGFASASDHTHADITLNLVLVILSSVTYRLITPKGKLFEFITISALSAIIWIALYIYYNQ